MYVYALLTDCAVIVMGFRSPAARPPLNSSRSPGTQPVDETDQRGLKHTASWLAQAGPASNGDCALYRGLAMFVM